MRRTESIRQKSSSNVCFTVDRNGIIFNAYARKKLCGAAEAAIERVEIAYNPILQMMVIHKATEETDSRNAMKWTAEYKNRLTMRKCGCKGFSNALFDNMGWNLDYKYKVIGAPMDIDGETVLVFTLENPIRVVPIGIEKEQGETRKTKNRATKELLEAGFAPEDFQVPTSVSDINLGSNTLNEKAKNLWQMAW